MKSLSRPSKAKTWFSLGLFFLLIWNTSFLSGVSQNERKAELMFSEGIELYKSSEYLKAIERFSQVLVMTKNKELKAEACFQLSLCNFNMEETSSAEEWIKRCLESNPGKEVSAVYPAEYTAMFNRIKRDIASAMMERSRRAREAAAQAPPPPAKKEPPAVTYRQAEPQKKGGGGKTMLFILGGVLVAGGLAFFLLKGKDKNGNSGNGATTGSIQVNSTPSGAEIFLDGANTGQTTNATLTDISPGNHTLSLKKDGYENYEASAGVTAGQTASINAPLTAHTITVSEPAAGTTWGKGSKVDITWDTNASVSANQVNLLVRRLNPAMSPAGHLARMRVLRSRGFRRGQAGGNQGAQDVISGRAAGTALNRASRIQNDTRNAGLTGISGNTDTPINSSLSAGGADLINGQTLVGPINQAGKVKPQAMANVKIDLYKGGSLAVTIASSTANDGSHSWNVPASQNDGDDYKVRVSNSGDGAVFAESGSFSIAGTGRIKVTSTPQGAAIWLDGINTKETTNTTLDNITTGSHTVRLVLDRYQEWEKQVNVQLNKTAKANTTLEIGSFTDNFNDGDSSFWEKMVNWGQWYVEGGVYKVESGHSEYPISYYNLGTFDNNFTYEGKVRKMIGDSRYWPCGLTFASNGDHTIFYLFGIFQSRKAYGIYKVQYDKKTGTSWPLEFLNWPEDNHPAINQNDWNTLKVIADGKNFSFYSNGKLLESLTIANAPNRGLIGIMADLRSAADKVGFDNLSLQYGQTTGSVAGIPAVPIKIKPNKTLSESGWIKKDIKK